MRYSRMLIPAAREGFSEEVEGQVPSFALLHRGGYLRQMAPGIFALLPLGMRVVHKVGRIIRQEMNRTGALEVLLPSLQPAPLWRESGRWQAYGPDLLQVQDRSGQQYALSPTAEETIVALLRGEVRTAQQLPLNLYQIQTKFRDEEHPRGGLLRGREFMMQDAYSFHADEADAHREYRSMCDTYGRIFRRCGLKYRLIEADPGAMGGTLSHEFQVLAPGDAGEDELLLCERCEHAGRAGRISGAAGDVCAACQSGRYVAGRGIEVGHVFYLGTHYSGPMSCAYVDGAGQPRQMIMGCYGIGLTRVVAAAVEQHHDAAGICWPMALSPYHAVIVPGEAGAAARAGAQRIYAELNVRGVEVLLDDRDESVEAQRREAELLGIPLRLSVTAADVELHRRDGSLHLRLDIDEVAAAVTGMVQHELENSLA